MAAEEEGEEPGGMVAAGWEEERVRQRGPGQNTGGAAVLGHQNPTVIP